MLWFPQLWLVHLGILDQVFERETNREKNLEKAAKEAKVKARKEAAKTSDNDKDRALDEQDILKVGFSLSALKATVQLAKHLFCQLHNPFPEKLHKPWRINPSIYW